jgi:hypothetical protein
VSNRFSPSKRIRAGLALGLTLLTVLLLWALLILTDTAYDVRARLKASPSWFLSLYAAAFLGIMAVGGSAARSWTWCAGDCASGSVTPPGSTWGDPPAGTGARALRGRTRPDHEKRHEQ